MNSALYRGTLMHSRRDSYAVRRFSYQVVMASIDLSELDELHCRLRYFSHNRPNLFALFDRNYSAGGATASTDLTASLHQRLANENLPLPASTRLLTNLATGSHVFNPVSFFLNYAQNGELQTVLAEVNNTYDGRFTYVLDDRTKKAGTTFRHSREFFVSPFLHGPCAYDFAFATPLDGTKLSVRMDVHRELDGSGERVFVAHFAGERCELTDRTLLTTFARFPFMARTVLGLIHWQAMKLHRLRVPYLRPDAGHRPKNYPNS